MAETQKAVTTLVENLDDKDFNEKIYASKALSIVLFGAKWCGPCKQVRPNVETIAKKYEGKVAVYYYDVDQYHGIANTLNIRGIPTLMMFNKGDQVIAYTGYTTASRIEQDLVNQLKK